MAKPLSSRTIGYPDGVNSSVDVGAVGQILCGQSRPQFFNGVVQVVQRLFEIIHPDVAVFGQKDYQQLHIIKHFTSGSRSNARG
jgi:pantoate--beta-alanine ligase